MRTLLLLALLAATASAQTPYVPPPGDWDRQTPAAVGMDPDSLAAAVAFAQANEAEAPRDLALAHARGFGREPYGEAVGPFLTRGPQTGVIVRHGAVVAEWGEPDRVDPTFSVAKSFLSTVAALAVADGRIALDDPVWRSQAPVTALGEIGPGARPAELGRAETFDLFPGDHNRRIIWDHLLRQTSDWEGELWGKPDWADRPDRDPDTWLTRPRVAPGTVYEYNDTRVNVLAMALLNVWRRPLPVVLRERVMDPIGASPTWRWHGYRTSWVLLDGQPVQSVSGGTHWGGGLWLTAFDQARFGLLTLRRGRWGDRQIVPDAWFDTALTPTPAEPGYGVMNYFLNHDRARFPSAPATAFAHLGAGVNLVYVDPEHDLVVVARWIDGSALDGLVARVLASITD
ncbi:serine hydrolase domain-containing protein [Rubrivirga sp. IMCC45206]|uniref:serine hydrolase domain-containing protein n=1 Tax=Rubrivirga sp. IMCC45206 TaxID=3391614 RepID=UPI00398FF112